MLPGLTLPLPPAEFLARHWQRAPLVMRDAARGLAHPHPDLLASLALDEAVESRIIQGGGNGPWKRRDGPFSERDFAALPERDWTLLVQSVDHCLTEVSLLLDSFSFLPGWRLEDIMISYAATGGSVGPHFDRYDVFLVQARGHRRWKLGPQCDETTPVENSGGVAVLPDMPVEEETLLGPGDVLYLPPWKAHWGIAEDDDCVTWSVGFRAPALPELLERVADQARAQTPLYRDPGRPVADSPGELSRADSLELLEQAAALFRDDTIRENALGQFLSEPRQETLDFEADLSHIRQRAPEAVLVRHGGARILVTGQGDQCRAWINGEARPLSATQAPLARRLASARLFTDGDLADLLSPEGQALLEEWINDGYFLRIQP